MSHPSRQEQLTSELQNILTNYLDEMYGEEQLQTLCTIVQSSPHPIISELVKFCIQKKFQEGDESYYNRLILCLSSWTDNRLIPHWTDHPTLNHSSFFRERLATTFRDMAQEYKTSDRSLYPYHIYFTPTFKVREFKNDSNSYDGCMMYVLRHLNSTRQDVLTMEDLKKYILVFYNTSTIPYSVEVFNAENTEYIIIEKFKVRTRDSQHYGYKLISLLNINGEFTYVFNKDEYKFIYEVIHTVKDDLKNEKAQSISRKRGLNTDAAIEWNESHNTKRNFVGQKPLLKRNFHNAHLTPLDKIKERKRQEYLSDQELCHSDFPGIDPFLDHIDNLSDENIQKLQHLPPVIIDYTPHLNSILKNTRIKQLIISFKDSPNDINELDLQDTNVEFLSCNVEKNDGQRLNLKLKLQNTKVKILDVYDREDTRVEDFDLSNTNVTYLSLECPINDLDKLKLQNTKVKYLVLGDNSSMHRLKLQGSNVKKLEFTSLSASSLNGLDLTNTQVMCIHLPNYYDANMGLLNLKETNVQTVCIGNKCFERHEFDLFEKMAKEKVLVDESDDYSEDDDNEE